MFLCVLCFVVACFELYVYRQHAQVNLNACLHFFLSCSTLCVLFVLGLANLVVRRARVVHLWVATFRCDTRIKMERTQCSSWYFFVVRVQYFLHRSQCTFVSYLPFPAIFFSFFTSLLRKTQTWCEGTNKPGHKECYIHIIHIFINKIATFEGKKRKRKIEEKKACLGVSSLILAADVFQQHEAKFNAVVLPTLHGEGSKVVATLHAIET